MDIYFKLSLLFLKISINLNFFGKIDRSMKSGRQRTGDHKKKKKKTWPGDLSYPS